MSTTNQNKILLRDVEELKQQIMAWNYRQARLTALDIYAKLRKIEEL